MSDTTTLTLGETLGSSAGQVTIDGNGNTFIQGTSQSTANSTGAGSSSSPSGGSGSAGAPDDRAA